MQSECTALRAGCWKENQHETGDTAQVSDPSITIHESYLVSSLPPPSDLSDIKKNFSFRQGWWLWAPHYLKTY